MPLQAPKFLGIPKLHIIIAQAAIRKVNHLGNKAIGSPLRKAKISKTGMREKGQSRHKDNIHS